MWVSKAWRAALVFCAAAAIPGCTGSPQQREAKFLKRGASQMERKDYARAVLEFQTAANAMPKDAEPYYRLGMAYLAAQNFEAAFSSFYKAASLNPKHAGAQLQLSRLMVASSDRKMLEDAQKRAQGVVTESPENSTAIETLAIAEFKLGNPDTAEGLIQNELAKAPADLQAAQVLARMKIARKDLAGAEEVLKKSAASAPKSAPAALALGQFYRLAGKLTEAEAATRRALELDPKYDAALFHLALIQTQSGHPEQAEETYRQLAAAPNTGFQSLYGRFLFSRGKRDAGLAELKRLYAANPGDRAIRSLLVSAYIEINRPEEAQKILADALKKNGRDTDALLQDSWLRANRQDLTGAEKELREVLKNQPNSAVAHFTLALVQRYQGFPLNMRQELNEALRVNPLYLPARLALANDFLNSGIPAAVIDLLDNAPEQQKNDLRVLALRNWALLNLGNTAEARNRIAEALRLARSPEFVLQEGIAKFLDRDYNGAQADAEQVLRSEPANLRAARLLVDAYAGRKQLPKAVEQVRLLASQNPKEPNLQVYLAQLLLAVGNPPEARGVLESAATNTGALQVHLAIAQLDLSEDRVQEARGQLETALKQAPRNPQALALMAQLEQKAGNVSAAVDRYREMLRADPSNAFVLNNIAYLTVGENPDEALQLAQQAVELAPDAAAIQDTIGWVLYRKGLYSRAVEHLKKAVETEPTPRREFHLAVCYLKTGDKALGKQILDAALKKDPNLPKTEQGW